MKLSGDRPASFDSFTSLLRESAPYLFAALILYLPAFDNGFREDDFVFLEHVRSVGWLGSVLSPDTHFAFYRPGALLLFRVEYLLFGLNGGLYIVFNFLVHLLTAVAGGAVLSRMDLRRTTVLTAIALFLFGYGHYGKQVMWASASGPLIANLLVVLALAFARPAQGGARGGSRTFAYLLLVLAPAFHESAIVTAWLVFIVPERIRPWRRPLPAVVLALSTLMWVALRLAFAGGFAAYSLSAATLLGVVPRCVRYFGFLAAPVQAVSGSGGGVALAATIIQMVLGFSVALAMVWLWRRDRRPAICLWTILAVVPFALVALPGGWLELRYLYAAALPWGAVVAILMSRTRVPGMRRAVLVIIVALSVALQLVLEKKYDGVSVSAETLGRATSAGSDGWSAARR